MTRLRVELLTSPPAFHFWNGRPHIGGFGRNLLEFVEQTLVDGKAIRGSAYETGAGLTSAWLIAIGLREVHSFCSSQDVCERVTAYLGTYPEERARWHCYVGPSELTLPIVAIAAKREPADFCLVDGGHGLDKVFNDFVYLNYLLKPGGIIAIDDLQLGSSRLLLELLLQKGLGYRLIGKEGKLAMLRKETDRRLLADFGQHLPLLNRLSACLDELPS